jgi:hypothetical protein
MQTEEILTYAQSLYHRYDQFKVGAFTSRRFTPEQFQSIRGQLVADSAGLLSMRRAGLSFEGRPINLISAGNGPVPVLLWSQMHGDESTATMAIADILKFLSTTRGEAETEQMLAQLTLHFLPMLNPDGASRFQRRTAQNIDMNRDALALATPEARILKKLQHDLKPEFGFNLHDQELSTVGQAKTLSTVALLAPAFDEQKSYNDVRTRARHLAACFAVTTESFVPGHVSRYDDAFEPRAFGDNMQLWGTSTLLVESGHTPGDPEKHAIRKLNAVGILASLHAIASGSLAQSDPDRYESLTLNGKRAYDVIIRNVRASHTGDEAATVDIAISYQVDTHTESTPVLIDMGDLHTFTALKEIDGDGKAIALNHLIPGKPFAWEEHFTP